MSLTKHSSKNSTSIFLPFAHVNFGTLLGNHLLEYYQAPYKELVFLCIGTDRSTGDSLGPIIGYKLENMILPKKNIHIIGTLKNPVHAKNLENKIKTIYNSYNHPFIVAIDACLGNSARIGFVKVAKGPLKPGAGVNKKLPQIGDLHITGIVNTCGYMEYLVLQNTRLFLVMEMAETIAKGIKFSLWKSNKGIISPNQWS
ncbi:MAG: spore protease YyaC [Alkaliphilus sp.]